MCVCVSLQRTYTISVLRFFIENFLCPAIIVVYWRDLSAFFGHKPHKIRVRMHSAVMNLLPILCARLNIFSLSHLKTSLY